MSRKSNEDHINYETTIKGNDTEFHLTIHRATAVALHSHLKRLTLEEMTDLGPVGDHLFRFWLDLDSALF